MSLPCPLVPADVDLKDFAFMPLDVRRLRDSDLAALESPEACWSAVLLWAASWHQIPAGSVPDDDRVLANLAGFGRVVKEWLRVKEGALRGWVKCSDGRLYHPVVAEKAVEAWNSKLHHAHDKLCDRLRKENPRRVKENLPPLEIPTYEQWNSAGRPSKWSVIAPDVPAENGASSGGKKKDSAGSNGGSNGNPDETPLKGEGQGEGQGEGHGLLTPQGDPDGSPGADDVGSAPPASEKLPDCPQQEIIAMFAELLPALPQPVAWDGARADALRARWRWYLADLKKKDKPYDKAAGIDFFRRLFAYVEKSDFLMGRKGDWQCDLGWIVKSENFAKILQGNYENKEPA